MREVEVGLYEPEYLYRQEGLTVSCFLVEDRLSDASLVGDDPIFILDLKDEAHAELLMDHLEKASV